MIEFLSQIEITTEHVNIVKIPGFLRDFCSKFFFFFFMVKKHQSQTLPLCNDKSFLGKFQVFFKIS